MPQPRWKHASPAKPLIRLFHNTTSDAASSILQSGFKDATGSFLTNNLYSGVWVSNFPLDCNDHGHDYEVYLVAELPEARLDRYEWIEDGKGYREWLAPAELLNEYAWRLVPDDEVDQYEEWWARFPSD